MIPPTRRSLPKQFRFEQPKSPPVVVNFQGGQVTSDAGLSLIAEIDRKLPAFGALSELQRVIKQIRQQWQNVEILVRGDSAYSRDDIMTW